MRQIKTRLLSCAPLLFMPVWALALNLGNVTLKSEPGEPLEAEIVVTGIAAEVRDSLSVGLADMEGFRWAGIDWTPALDRLQFELQRGAGDALSIRIHTDEALAVARLHILLRVAWERGRLFREYTLELESAPQAVAQPATQPATGTDLLIVTPDPDDAQDDTPTAIRPPDAYDVTWGDTLWAIASELRPDRSVTINQMMLALLRVNPQAFSENNINWLRAGATLSMPGASELRALSVAQAYAEVLAQNNVWRLTRGYPPLAAEPQLPSQARAGEAELRLAPLSGESPEAEQEVVAAAAASAPAQAEAQALTLANEQLSQENVALTDKLVTAESAIDELKRLVEIKDDELAAIQEQRIQAQTEPGPGLPERAQAFVAALPELARSYWHIISACALALLILLGWFLLRNKMAHSKGLASPAASVRSDFPAALKRAGNNAHIAAAQTETGEVEEPEPFADKDKDEEVGEPELLTSKDEDEEVEGPELLTSKDEDEEVEGPELFVREDQGSAVEEPELPVQERTGEQDEDPESEGEEEEEAEDLVWNKLELACAYLDLGDTENVYSILDEVLAEGNAAQREEARQLLQRAAAHGSPGAA